MDYFLSDIRGKIIIVFAVGFVFNMILIFFNHRKKVKKMTAMKNHTKEGSNLETKIINGSGRIELLLVDEKPPIKSIEVLKQVYFIPYGEHKIVFRVIAKDNSIVEKALPYKSNYGPFESVITADEEHQYIRLCFDVITQEIYLEDVSLEKKGV